jgi:thiol-disulfide isomerase/thioredoxin
MITACSQTINHTSQEPVVFNKTDYVRAVAAPDFKILHYNAGAEDSQHATYPRDFQGKPVILNFWAASCPPCRAEMPDFQILHESKGNEVSIIGIDVGQFSGLGTQDQAQALIDQFNITYLTGTALSSDILKDYRVVSMPTTVFINSDGMILREWSGIIDPETLSNIASALVLGAP